MKKWFIISLIFNLIIFLCIAYISLTWRGYYKTIVSKYVQAHIQQKKTMFEVLPIRDSAIIFLGNSITEGVNWSELFDNSNILNRGIGGDMTKGMLNRMDEITRHNPSKLFIVIGTNDIGSGIQTSEIIENYNAIIRKVKASSPTTKIYIQSVLPVAIPKGSLYRHNNKGILAVNQELKKMSADLNVTYIDLHSHFIDKNGNLKATLTNDGLHLLGAGYLLWKEVIQNYISE